MNYDRCIRAGGPPLPGRQRGATLIIVAGFLVALLTCMALAIEVGRLYAAQSSLQKTANLAAIDAVRQVSGCTASQSNPLAAAQSAVNSSVNANMPGDVTVDPTVTLGSMTMSSDGTRRLFTTTVPADQPPDAVQVGLERDPPTLLSSLLSPSGAKLRATAAAHNQVVGAIEVAGSTAGLEPQLLSALLGGTSVGVLDPDGLANAFVNLADLATELGVATPEQLLETNLPLVDILDGMGDVTSGSVSASLDTLAAVADPATNVLLSDILSVAGPIGEDLAVNVGSLTGGLAALAAFNRDEAITLDITQGLPATIGSVQAHIRILEPPQLAIGPPGINPNTNEPYTEARSAQALVQLDINLLNFGGFSLTELTLFIEAGRAEAFLDEVECAGLGQPLHRVFVDPASDLARIGIGTVSDLNGNNPEAQEEEVTLLTLPLLGSVITVDPFSIPIGGANPSTVEFEGEFPPEEPFEPSETFEYGGDLDGALSAIATGLGDNISIVGIPLPLGSLLGPLTALLDNILAPVLEPVFQALGLSLGGGSARVMYVDAERPQVFLVEAEQSGN